MESLSNLQAHIRTADADAAMWERMAREADENAKRYRQHAKNRHRDAADYRAMADRVTSEINESLKGIAA